MKATKFATLGQIPVWFYCVGLLLIIGCVVFQPQNHWTYSKNIAVPGHAKRTDTIVYASVPADEITVQATKTGKKYHRGDCRYLEKSKVGTTVLEARQKGLTACKVCKPPK